MDEQQHREWVARLQALDAAAREIEAEAQAMLAERRDEIAAMWTSGTRLQTVCDYFGISRKRASRLAESAARIEAWRTRQEGR